MPTPTTPTELHGTAPRSPADKTRRTTRLLGASIAAVALAAGLITPWQAPESVGAAESPAPTTGEVVVFETETTPLVAFNNPDDCNNAPALAHTITNYTNNAVTLYADDRCGVPLIDVAPGFGSHVAPGQSFSTFEAAVEPAESPATQPAEGAPSVTGRVLIYETETMALTAFDDPQACNNAPELAHTIMNHTNSPITLFADDRCGVELIDLEPGMGSHVAPGQSFADIS